jgi:16S rRNA (cytosine1402-N4)-methyltransferase
MNVVHTPVLLNETLEYLAPLEEPMLMIDGTLGEGGHTEAFLNRFPQLNIIGLDADQSIQVKARERLAPFGDRITFVNTWFDDFFADYHDPHRPDRILLDLGISVYHYEESERGFSFSRDESLDMRLDPTRGESAEDLVNHWSEKDLADIIYRYGEERYSRRIAGAICRRRKESPIVKAADLADLIKGALPAAARHGRIHGATRTFQAIRIAVNGELDRLERVLTHAFRVLKPQGLFGVITFHSLEDRMVKNVFRDWDRLCLCPPAAPRCTCGDIHRGKMVTRKPIGPTEEEIRHNSPSRSAKLRVIKKITDQEAAQ